MKKRMKAAKKCLSNSQANLTILTKQSDKWCLQNSFFVEKYGPSIVNSLHGATLQLNSNILGETQRPVYTSDWILSHQHFLNQVWLKPFCKTSHEGVKHSAGVTTLHTAMGFILHMADHIELRCAYWTCSGICYMSTWESEMSYSGSWESEVHVHSMTC